MPKIRCIARFDNFGQLHRETRGPARKFAVQKRIAGILKSAAVPEHVASDI